MNAGVRGCALGLALVSAIALWQCWPLERWSFDGPGAGLFPQAVAIVCLALAVLVAVFPAGTGARPAAEILDAQGDAEAGSRIETGGTFAIYALTLGVLCAGAAWAGFTVTSILVSVMIVRFAERRSWAAALAYGVIGALVGLVVFGWLLRVDLPAGPIEHAFFSWVR